MALDFPVSPVQDQKWTDTNGEKWIFNGEMWRRLVNAMQGPQGIQGPEGPEGPAGTDGSQTYEGDTKDPGMVDGDTWIETIAVLPFETLWRFPDPDITITLPLVLEPDCLIDWGDGAEPEIVTTINPQHTFAVAGDYTISVSGYMPHFMTYWESDPENYLIQVTQWGDTRTLTWEKAFEGCWLNFEGVTATDSPNLSNVTDISSMFADCNEMSVLNNIENWDVSNVEDFSYMFYSVIYEITSLDLSNWDLSSAITMDSTFEYMQALTSLNISGWDTKYIESMINMFSFTAYLIPQDFIDISHFDIRSLTTANGIFSMYKSVVSTDLYDSLLIAWAAQDVQHNVPLTVGGSYTASSSAEDARNILLSKGWKIVDAGPVSVDKPMILEYTLDADNVTVALPCIPSTTYGNLNITVDWGDGSNPEVFVDSAVQAEHTYVSAGVYIISFTGFMGQFKFLHASRDKLTDIKQWGLITAAIWTGACNYCYGLTDISATDQPNMQNEEIDENFRYFFRNCTNLTGRGIENWAYAQPNLHRNISLNYTFYYCTNLEVGPKWTIERVGNLGNYLYNCPTTDVDFSNIDISDIDSNHENFISSPMLTNMYDKTLIAWGNQADVTRENVAISFNTSKYSAFGQAEQGRDALVYTAGWTITDGGPA